MYTNKHLGQLPHHTQGVCLLPTLQLLNTLWYCLKLLNNNAIWNSLNGLKKLKYSVLTYK